MAKANVSAMKRDTPVMEGGGLVGRQGGKVHVWTILNLTQSASPITIPTRYNLINTYVLSIHSWEAKYAEGRLKLYVDFLCRCLRSYPWCCSRFNCIYL